VFYADVIDVFCRLFLKLRTGTYSSRNFFVCFTSQVTIPSLLSVKFAEFNFQSLMNRYNNVISFIVVVIHKQNH